MASTTLAKTITDKASIFLADASQTRWLPSELLSWLNDGQSEICALVPNANPSTATVVLVGGIKQAAPTDALYVNGFIRNMGVGGTTGGGVIRQVTRSFLNSFVAGWASAATSTVVSHIAYDPADSNVDFYVYPPQPATGMSSIEIVYSQVPTIVVANDTPVAATTIVAGKQYYIVTPGTTSWTNIGAASATVGLLFTANSTTATGTGTVTLAPAITIKDIYANALLDYVLYRAFGKDSEYGNQSDRSQIHYKMFSQAIGIKYTIEKAENSGYGHNVEQQQRQQQANSPQ